MAIDREQYIDHGPERTGYAQSTFVAPFSWSGSSAGDTYQAGYDALADADRRHRRRRRSSSRSPVRTPRRRSPRDPGGSKELSQTAAIVQSAAKQIGLTVDIDERQAADFAAIFLDPNAREDIDFVATTGYTETPGVLAYPQLFTLPAELGGIFNWSGYSNDR